MPELDTIMAQAQGVENVAANVPLWGDALFVGLGLWGIFVWLFGRRLVRLTFALIGLIGGAAAGGLVFAQFWPELNVLPWTIAGALVGGVMCWLLFRLWVALLMASIAALLTPWIIAALQGTPTPDAQAALRESAQQIVEEGKGQVGRAVSEAADDLAERVEQIAREAAEEAMTDEGDSGDQPLLPGGLSGNDGGGSDDAAAVDEADEPTAMETIKDLFRRQWQLQAETWGVWWSELSSGIKWTILSGAVLGAIVAFIVGLMVPNLSAGIVSSMIGVGFMLIALNHLAVRMGDQVAAYLPQGPRETLAFVVVAGLLGGGIQWIFSRKSADK